MQSMRSTSGHSRPIEEPEAFRDLKIEREARRLDPRIGVVDAATMDQLVSLALARPRFLSLLLGGFTGLALLVGMLGLYGVLAYAVALRRREMAMAPLRFPGSQGALRVPGPAP